MEGFCAGNGVDGGLSKKQNHIARNDLSQTLFVGNLLCRKFALFVRQFGFYGADNLSKRSVVFCCANPLHKCGLKCSSLLGSKAHSGQTSKGDKSQTKRRSALS